MLSLTFLSFNLGALIKQKLVTSLYVLVRLSTPFSSLSFAQLQQKLRTHAHFLFGTSAHLFHTLSHTLSHSLSLTLVCSQPHFLTCFFASLVGGQRSKVLDCRRWSQKCWKAARNKGKENKTGRTSNLKQI